MTMMNLLTYYLPLASDYSSLLAIRSHAARSVSSERYSSCFHSWSGLSFVHTSFLITILAVIPVLHSYAYGVRSPRLCPSLFRVSSVLTSDKNKVKMFLFQFTVRVLLTHCFSYFLLYFISATMWCIYNFNCSRRRPTTNPFMVIISMMMLSDSMLLKTWKHTQVGRCGPMLYGAVRCGN